MTGLGGFLPVRLRAGLRRDQTFLSRSGLAECGTAGLEKRHAEAAIRVRMAEWQHSRGPPKDAGIVLREEGLPRYSAWRYVVSSIASRLLSMESRDRRVTNPPPTASW